MNLKIILLLCQLYFACTVPVSVWAQTASSKTAPVRYQSLELSTKLTTVLVFPAAICEGCVDRGHPDIATNTVTGMRNVLRVKASSDELPVSNLTVFTTDGRIYSFTVSYKENPVQTLLSFENDQAPALAQFSSTTMNEADIEFYAKVVAAIKPEFKRPRERTNGNMQISLVNLHQKNGFLFFKFSIRNSSAIDYDLNFSRFYIRDRKAANRTAMMEKAVQPAFVLEPPGSRVAKFSECFVTVAIEKFTIADNKYFVAEIFEKNGDRPLTLKIKGKHLLRARSD